MEYYGMMASKAAQTRARVVRDAGQILALQRAICDAQPGVSGIGEATRRFLTALVDQGGYTEVAFGFEAALRQVKVPTGAIFTKSSRVTLYAGPGQEGSAATAAGSHNSLADLRKMAQRGDPGLLGRADAWREQGLHEGLVEHLRFDRPPFLQFGVREEPREGIPEFWWQKPPDESSRGPALRGAFAGLMFERSVNVVRNLKPELDGQARRVAVEEAFDRIIRHPWEVYRIPPEESRPWFPLPGDRWPLSLARSIQVESGRTRVAAPAALIPQATLSPVAGLTPRESQCVRLDAQGFDNEAIAKVFGISAGAVRAHLSNARAKLNQSPRRSGEQGRNDKNTKARGR